MSNATASNFTEAIPETDARAAELLAAHRLSIWSRTDRLFAGLLAFEWLAGIVLTSVKSPRVWDGATSAIHPHVWAAALLGGCIVSLPVWLAIARSGRGLTRQVVAAAQMLMSALLIHFGDGRIEMHFHIFGSLAFLAFYRDWKVLITASLVVSLDHLCRGFFAPASIYGVSTATTWRTFEHAGWVVFEDVFLVSGCVQAVREMRGIALNRALLEQSHRDVEQKVVERTRQLKDAQADLVRTARTAGMAEIATSVLHNVGNVLNSVNVSATVVADKLRRSELGTLTQVSELIVEHKPDLGAFLAGDERGRMIPDFISELAVCLNQEQQAIQAEVESLVRGIDHIKHVVAAQQSMAKKHDLRAAVDPAAVFENAVKLQSTGASVDFRRRFDGARPVELDEHKVLQILINLISNARQAVAAQPDGRRQVTLELSFAVVEGAERVRFSVGDTGVGIAPENLARVFAHGFTTKREGHGFGLHGAANAAREMGGDLAVASPGIGLGATFTLELPVAAAAEAAGTLQESP